MYYYMNYTNFYNPSPMTIKVFEIQEQMREARKISDPQERRKTRRVLLHKLIKAMQSRRGEVDPRVIQIILTVENRAKQMGLRNYGQQHS